MQFKKEEVKHAILNEAEKEFLEKGFQGASVRKIAKKAGTTIGNFYNYFESKEALFDELVREEYKSFLYFLNNHDKIERLDFLWDIPDPSQWRKVLTETLQQILPRFSIRFVLLTEGSKGTRYEETRGQVLDMMKDHFLEHLHTFGMGSADEGLAPVIAEQVLTGITMILRSYKDEDIRNKLLTEHFLYHFIGTMGLLGNWS